MIEDQPRRMVLPFLGTYAVEALWLLIVPVQVLFPRLAARLAQVVH